jgi:hypothetical protein
MDARMMEVLVFVDGIDAMTSKAMQARRSYQPSEMAMNQQVGALAGKQSSVMHSTSHAAAGLQFTHIHLGQPTWRFGGLQPMSALTDP